VGHHLNRLADALLHANSGGEVTAWGLHQSHHDNADDLGYAIGL